jgi:ABC-type uncharacterized transport system substrate-binding protein
MTKNKEFTEVLGILEDVYGWNDTNELTEMQAELVNDVISVVKKLTIPVVSQRSELLLAYHRYLTEELSLDLNEIWVDEHLKANNCG